MKKIISILLVGAAILACSKEKAVVDSPVAAAPSDVKTITVSLPASLSKVAFSPAAEPDGGVALSWAAGDKIRIISGSESAVYEIQPGFEGHTASFSGPSISGSSFTIIYPADFESESAAAAGDPFANQVQNGNGSTDGLKYVAVLSGVDSFEDIQFNDEWATAHGGSFRQNGIKQSSAAVMDTTSATGVAQAMPMTPTRRLSRNIAGMSTAPLRSMDRISGVTFLVEYSTDEGETWEPIQLRNEEDDVQAGYCTSEGLEDSKLTTGEDGMAVFSGLCVDSQLGEIRYRITEVATVPGYSLLPDYAFEGTLSEQSETDVSFTVVNQPEFAMPSTGGHGFHLIAGIVAFLSLALGAVFLLRGKATEE